MRFAYIDSQGKEVGIPSVEALQLRIELGAIGEETMFFDGNTDRWAPAKEHEVFRTLSLELEKKAEGGFVAPPPPTMMGRSPGPGEEEAPEDGSDVRFDFELDLIEGPDAESHQGREAPPGPESEEAGTGDVFDLDELDTVDFDSGVTAGPEAPPDDPGPREMDWGDVESGGAASPEPDPWDVEAGDPAGAVDREDEVDGGAGTAEGASEDLDAGLGLEPPLSEWASQDGPSWDDAEAEPTERFDLEDPATAWWGHDPAEEVADESLEVEEGGPSEAAAPFDAAAPPPDAAEAPGAPRDDLSGKAGVPSGDEGDELQVRRRQRPTHLRRRKQSPVARIAATALGLAAVGAAGWFGWGFLQDRGGDESTGQAQVELPALPERLQATYRDAAASAYAAMVDSIGSLGADLPTAPSEEWLSGNYLANASSFRGVEDYWVTLQGYLARIRSEDEPIFLSAFRARLDSLEVASADREALLERARTGFQASGSDRRAVYAQLDALVRASLELHDFLVGNEASIEYEPAAAGLSRDPVTEAVPATVALGDSMWDGVAEITTALDNLGALERLTTDRLLGIVLDKLSTIPPR